jgi:hypothetical protein
MTIKMTCNIHRETGPMGSIILLRIVCVLSLDLMYACTRRMSERWIGGAPRGSALAMRVEVVVVVTLRDGNGQKMASLCSRLSILHGQQCQNQNDGG